MRLLIVHSLTPPPPSPLLISAPGDTGVPPTHEEVLQATDARAVQMQALVKLIVSRIPFKSLTIPPAFATLVSCGGGVNNLSFMKRLSTTFHSAVPLAGAVLAGALGGAAVVAIVLSKQKR
jgi:hypothetical protein